MSTRIPGRARPATKPVIRTPVQARSRATVEAILGGTRRVLASRGYAGTTTNHIAEAAGVSIGSFYQYFGDKDAAVAAYAEQFAQETLAFAADHVGQSEDAPTAFAAWLTALSIHACEQAALVRVLFQEVPYLWSLPGFRDAMAGALMVVEQLGGDVLTDEAQHHDRAFVILKSAVAVIIEVAADPELRARRASIIDELALMIDAYLGTARMRR
jgi:AcrR family transcriptional regulator